MTFVFIRFHSFLSDSRLKGLRIRNLKIIDSTTLRLFSDLLRVVGRNPIHGGRKENAVFHVRNVIIDNTKKKNAKGVLKEQYVSLLQGSRWHTKETPTAQDHLQGRQRKGILLHDQQL